jgi:hypothetical protein
VNQNSFKILVLADTPKAKENVLGLEVLNQSDGFNQQQSQFLSHSQKRKVASDPTSPFKEIVSSPLYDGRIKGLPLSSRKAAAPEFSHCTQPLPADN